MSADPKTFRQALLKVASSSQKAKDYLTDERLTQQEKTILAAFLDLRDFQNDSIIQMLSCFKCENDFVESQRLYCLGCAYNNLTDYSRSRAHLLESIKLNMLPEDISHRAQALNSLFTVYDNMGDGEGMLYSLEILRNTEWPDYHAEIILTCCEFRYFVHLKQFDIALELTSSLERILQEMTEHQVVAYLFDLIDLHVAQRDFVAVGQVLERFKDYWKFKFGPLIQYYRGLLEFIKNGGTLYLYENGIQDVPQFKIEMQILLYTQERQLENAQSAWTLLREVAPYQYLEFPHTNKDTLFGLTLEKLLSVTSEQNVDLHFQENGRVELLIQLLMAKPLRKETLYAQIWNETPESKEDLNRLAKLVSKAREKYGVDIKSVKSTYVLTRKKIA